MKFHESDYQSAFSDNLYDAIRLASDFFDRESLEKFTIPDDLLKSMSQASRLYTEEKTRFKLKEKQILMQEAAEVKRKLGIYERKADTVLNKEIWETETEIEAIEKKLAETREKKRRLEEDCTASKKRREAVSASVIDGF